MSFYFPTTALVASFNPEAVGTPMAASLIGASSVIGLGSLPGDSPVRHDMTVLLPGKVLRPEVGLLRDEFDRSPQVRRMRMAVIRACIDELTQLATCHRFHTLEQQLCLRLRLRLVQIMDHVQSGRPGQDTAPAP